MEKSMPIAVVAVVISVVAIALAAILQPTLTIGAEAVGTNELADDAVTSGKIADGTITDADIADGSITLQDLSSAVVNVITGIENIADNSITSAEIADETIQTVDIANNSITSEKIADGTITLADIGPIIISSIDGVSNDGGDIDLVSSDGSITIVPDDLANKIDIGVGVVTQTAENWAGTTDTTTAWATYENLDDARVEITTGNNPVLIMFSGVFSDNMAGGRVRIGLTIDDGLYAHATRTGTSAAVGDPFVLTFNCMPTLSAGTHTIQVVWQTYFAGTEATAYNRVLDVIELKG